MAGMEATLAIDLTGLRCPLPVLRTKKALSQLASGDLLRVFATDSDAAEDIPAYVGQAGHLLERQETADGGHVFYIRKR